MQRTHRNTIFRTLAVTVVALALTLGLSQLKAMQDLEATTFDVRMLAFPPETRASDAIVMIWLDEATMAALPYRTPIPRNFLAQLHERIMAAKPKLVGYDIFFKGASFPKDDQMLVAALSGTPAYGVFPRRADGSADAPDPLFLEALAGTGLADLPFDPFDSTVRRAQVRIETEQGTFPSFAAELYHAATGMSALATISEEALRPHLGPLALTPFVAPNEQILIRFAGPPGVVGGADNAYKIYSAALVHRGLIPTAWLEDKIVLVGASYTDLKDAFLTPYYSPSTDYARMNGVEIHANILSSLLTQQFFFAPTRLQVWICIALGIVVMAFIAARLSPWGTSGCALLFGCAIAGSAIAAFRFGIVLPIIAPMTGLASAFGSGLGLRALTEGKQKRFIKGVFARYVPPTIVDRMTAHPELVKLGGEKRRVTSLFSDIASFTTISERLDPETLVAFLNDYLGCMNEALLAQGATIDKYEGDAIIAFFNAPLDVADHERCAVHAAIAMQRIETEVTERWQERCGRAIVTRIGINTGSAVVGNMGSEGRFDYTAIGDTINLASRLEGANKFYDTTLMASEATMQALGDEVISRPLDCIRVKGKREPIRIFEIMGLRSDMDPERERGFITPYHEAFADFTARKFDDAHRIIAELLNRFPNDGPSRSLLARIERARTEPNWDLVTDLMGK